jgi:hypothetical protein
MRAAHNKISKQISKLLEEIRGVVLRSSLINKAKNHS